MSTKIKSKETGRKGKQTQDPGPSESVVGPIVATQKDYEIQEEIDEEIGELMAQRGETIPDIKTLLTEAKEIQQIIVKAKTAENQTKKDSKSETWSDEMAAVERELAEIEVLEQQTPSPETEENITPTQSKKKPHFDTQNAIKPNMDDYQESFTSQQETSELRDEVSSLGTRLANLETTIESLLRERQNLPEHLNRITNDINKQFTLMNEKLHASIEAGIPAHTAQQAVEQVSDLSGRTNVVLNTASQELSDPPSKISSISHSRPITETKRRIRLID